LVLSLASLVAGAEETTDDADVVPTGTERVSTGLDDGAPPVG
jgi:hypothetical protein